MEYQGSDNDDLLDQAQLQLPDWSRLLGHAGNDTFHLGIGHAVGGQGNDTFHGVSRWSNVAYWWSPAGVKVDLSAGKAEDGFGGSDTFAGIVSVHGSPHDDVFTGSERDEYFHGGGGNDTFAGGAGADEVLYYNVPSTEAQIEYDVATDTFTVRKSFSNGDRGVDRLIGIERISFTGEGADGAVVWKDTVVPVDGFLRVQGSTSLALGPAGVTQVKAGDFDGNGAADLYLASQVATGTAPAPFFILLGDGAGRFLDGKGTLFPQAPDIIVGGGRSLVADFNNDGRSDVFQFDFGDDAPPWPGGLNHLFLSSPGTQQLADESHTLDQAVATNHAGSAGDVNGDGFVDVLANTLSLGNVLFLNDGTGHFLRRTDLLPRWTVHGDGTSGPRTNTASAMADVDGDGWLDLLLGRWEAASSTPATRILLNDGRGDFSRAVPVDLPATSVYRENVMDIEPIDLNGDRLADLMVSVTNGGGDSTTYGSSDYYTTAYIQLLVNEGGGRFRDETELRLPAAVQSAFGRGWFDSLTSIDFNQDGHSDIFAALGGFTKSFVLLNQGDGTFRPGWSSPAEARAVAADVDGDGATDIAAVVGDSVFTFLNRLDSGRVYKARFGGDRLLGSAGDDTFFSSDGEDVLEGGGGIDTVVYDGGYASFSLTRTATGFLVEERSTRGVADTLHGFERIRFTDADLALDVAGPAGQAYRLYQAAFNRSPDVAGLGFHMKALDTGWSLTQVAQNFIHSPEFVQAYGSLDDVQFVTQLYRNVLHREPEAAGLDYHTANLASGVSRAQTLVGFSESPENQVALIGTIQNGMLFTPA